MQATILLVDDNEEFIDSIKDVLEDENCIVSTANSGEAACFLTERNSYDLVLMDIKMPGMNGVECFLRMKEKNPNIKVVLFTAYALEELIRQAHDNGITAVIKKPLDMDYLLGVIQKVKKKSDGGYILIADDDIALRENLLDILSQYGYRVAAVSDGPSAIREAETNAYDILLLDLKMPELNGLEVYRKIKAIRPSVITILMTGYAEELEDLVEQAMHENAYTILPKPIDMNRLLQLLNRASEDKKRGIIQKPSLEV